MLASEERKKKLFERRFRLDREKRKKSREKVLEEMIREDSQTV